MKKFGLVVVGVVAALLASVACLLGVSLIEAFVADDRFAPAILLYLLVGAVLGCGAFLALRKAARMGPGFTADWSNPAPQPVKPPRPWER
jgi:hypothetical protein